MQAAVNSPESRGAVRDILAEIRPLAEHARLNEARRLCDVVEARLALSEAHPGHAIARLEPYLPEFPELDPNHRSVIAELLVSAYMDTNEHGKATTLLRSTAEQNLSHGLFYPNR
jgi:hypothetical protein